MLRNKKAIKAFAITLTMVTMCSMFSLVTTAKVKPGYSEVPTIGEPSLNPNYTSVKLQKTISFDSKSRTDAMTRSSGTLILDSEGTLGLASSNQLRVTGSTDTYFVVNQVQYLHELQKWNGTSWTAVSAYGRSAYNTSGVSGINTTTVSAGYYRLGCSASAFNSGTSDYATNTSTWIQVQ